MCKLQSSNIEKAGIDRNKLRALDRHALNFGSGHALEILRRHFNSVVLALRVIRMNRCLDRERMTAQPP